MRIHIICAVLVLTLAPFFHVSWKEFLLLCVVTMMVLFAEIINTAMEVVVDLVTDGKHHEYAKVVKDVAAGAVLLTSSLALFVGIMVFGAKVICFFK
jgi:diacylglycerol kinase